MPEVPLGPEVKLIGFAVKAPVSKPPLTSCACVVDALNARAAATAMLLPIIVFKIFIEFFYVRLFMFGFVCLLMLIGMFLLD
jgi:hypothetical protein